MRERSVIWDILTVGLLFCGVVTNGIILMQNNHLEALVRKSIDAPREVVRTRAAENPVQPTESAAAQAKSHSASYYDERMYPKFTRGDEKADDGDTLVINFQADSNSLNYLIDNDANVADFFELSNETLAKRSFDDNTLFEPRLARAWEKAMVCRGLAAKKNAKELAARLNAGLPEAERAKLNIAKIEAESDEILRIELSDTTGEYREPVLKLLGENAILPQHWIYVNFESGNFSDGKPINAHAVGELLRARATLPEAAGHFLPDWERDSSVVVRVAGDGPAVQAALKAYAASEQNSADVDDQKAASGKTRKAYLTIESTERYDFEERPVFTFYLRPNVKYHDGHAFTGKDAVFTFNTMMNPAIKCDALRNYYQDCESVALLENDPMTVRFTWRKPYFIAFAQSAEMPIIPEHFFGFKNPKQFNEGKNNDVLMGTGPYKFEKWTRKEQLTFVRNDDYWGFKGHFKRIVCKFVKDTTVGLQMLKVGQMDVEGLTKTQAAQILSNDDWKQKFKFENSTSSTFRYLGYNGREEMFKSVKTRQALTMLVDRERICKTIMKGFATPLDAPAHPDTPTFPKDPPTFPFSIANAKKLLAEDGWERDPVDNVLYKTLDGKRTPFKFNLMVVSGSTEFTQMADQIKDDAAQAGVIVNVANLEWTVFQQKLEQFKFDAYILGWQLSSDDDPYQIWHSSQAIEKGSNHVSYKNADVDRWIEEGRRELNTDKRLELFHKVYRKLAEDQPYTNLFVSKRTVLYDKRLNNVVYKFVPVWEIPRWWVPRALQKAN